MKKIYSKFTKDRRIQFQIETYIAENQGKRFVAKRALTDPAKSHVQALASFYDNFSRKSLLCPARLKEDDTVVFDFLSGNSLCKEMLAALNVKDKDAFNGYLTHYHDIIREMIDAANETAKSHAFKDEATFVEVFGNINIGVMETAKLLDIDLTFDNIIHVTDEDTINNAVGDVPLEHYQVIDYEWIFPFEVPVNYAVYRAISAFYMKYASMMKEVVTLSEMYDLFLIDEEQIALFEEMNRNFDGYVYGMYGAHQITKKYAKQTYDVQKLIPEQNLFVQMFWNDGKGYSEEKSLCIPVARPEADVVIPVDSDDDIKEFRVDPLNVSSLIGNVSIEVLLVDKSRISVNSFQHNGIVTKQGAFLFAHEDPQFKFDNRWGSQIVGIALRFDILKAGMAEDPILPYLAERKTFKERVKALLK